MIRPLEIVAQPCAVAQTEAPATLLPDGHTRSRNGRTVALHELVGIGERLDRAAELLGRDEVEILDVVGVLRIGIRPTRRLGHRGQPVPRHAGVIDAGDGVGEIQDAAIDTGFEKPLADLVPLKGCHSLMFPFSEEKGEDPVVKVVGRKETVETTQRQPLHLIW